MQRDISTTGTGTHYLFLSLDHPALLIHLHMISANVYTALAVSMSY